MQLFPDGLTFAYPWVLWFLVLPILLGVWYFLRLRKKLNESVHFPSVHTLANRGRTVRERLHFTPALLRLIALMFIIVALARPQTYMSGQNIFSEGIDITVVLDVSTSMLAEDFKPNRLEAAKSLTDEFVQGRVSDRIGLVIFSRDAYTQCPMTTDYVVLRNLLKDIKSGVLEDGTAIGNAIANGVNRLRESKAKSKIIILLTDGVNNAGEVNPVTAAEIASSFGVRVYTIGVGTRGTAPYPMQTAIGVQYQNVPVEIDEPLLKQIAETTGGKYFRATGNKGLEEIYKEIDKLERSKVEVTSYRAKTEHFYPWVLLALFTVLIEFLLSKTYLRKLP